MESRDGVILGWLIVKGILRGDVNGSEQPLSLKGHGWQATSDFETLESHRGDISKEVTWPFKKWNYDFAILAVH